MKAPIPLLILLYSTIAQSLKVVSKRGSGKPGYVLLSPPFAGSNRNGAVRIFDRTGGVHRGLLLQQERYIKWQLALPEVVFFILNRKSSGLETERRQCRAS